MNYMKRPGVPQFESTEFAARKKDYVVLIPIINEGDRIIHELERAKKASISETADIVICDGGSTDGCTETNRLKELGVNTLLVKQDAGKQGAQLRMGIWWSIQRGYKGIITIDGNDKDSIEDIPKFIEKLKEGYDFVQGSRFIKGGKAVNTPISRLLAVKLIHAPIISLTAHHHFTDTTNDKRVQPLRDVFMTYELLAYLSIRASQIGLKVCEIPVTRAYPISGKTPTKISFFKGNYELLKILLKNMLGAFAPSDRSGEKV